VRVQTHAADLTDPGGLAELERMVTAAAPDLLVNNAGFAGYREFCDVDPKVVSDLVAVHVTAASRLARAAACAPQSDGAVRQAARRPVPAQGGAAGAAADPR
jgi:short-subunit dehydrogenase